jgi:hypothetical protein
MICEENTRLKRIWKGKGEKWLWKVKSEKEEIEEKEEGMVEILQISS